MEIHSPPLRDHYSAILTPLRVKLLRRRERNIKDIKGGLKRADAGDMCERRGRLEMGYRIMRKDSN